MDTRIVRRYPIWTLLALLTACPGELPLVERFQQGEWQPEQLEFAALAGQRDGTRVFFSLELQGNGDRRLRVEATIEINPQARLASGSWVEENGSQHRSGVVSAPAVDFLGGQGGRPSMGGQFILSTAGTPFYRVNLPTTHLESRNSER